MKRRAKARENVFDSNTAIPEFTSDVPLPLKILKNNPADFNHWIETIRGIGETKVGDEDINAPEKEVQPKTRMIGQKRKYNIMASTSPQVVLDSSAVLEEHTANAAESSSNQEGKSALLSSTSQSAQIYHEMQIEVPSLGSNQQCLYINSNDVCDICKKTMEMATELPVMVCPHCNSTRTCYQGNKSTQSSQASKYIRKVHFRLYLTRFQWRETMMVPVDVIWHVANFLAQNGYTDETTTVTKIRWALQELRLSKWYNNITQIYCRVCNVSPPCLTPDEVRTFFDMFDEIQDAYFQIDQQLRTNFLSYQYVMYKLCELRGLAMYLPYFKMLKGDTNLQAHDEIWKRICEKLDWTFIETNQVQNKKRGIVIVFLFFMNLMAMFNARYRQREIYTLTQLSPR
jgi:DNA-directed RNA polymerase subunit RPC12/RpoP